ncbi:MAG: hypothetical protein [Siphoviridae sp. ctpQM7]|nr:MAG: hypothetical protein [Siphoviridae sp. ctpQM7]
MVRGYGYCPLSTGRNGRWSCGRMGRGAMPRVLSSFPQKASQTFFTSPLKKVE